MDSDGDGLLDKEEDLNGNCYYDMYSDPKETDRLYPDTDADGVSDLIEETLGSDPEDQTSTPQTIGKYFFVLPYNRPAQPEVQGGADQTRGCSGWTSASSWTRRARWARRLRRCAMGCSTSRRR